MQAILRGRRHRHLTKTTRWHLKREQARDWINLFENMHTGDYFGLGAALFYNAILFLVVVGFVSWMAISWLYHHNLHGVLVTTSEALASIAQDARMMPEGQPAMIISQLHMCGHVNPESSHELFIRFAEKKCVVCGVLYLVIFLLSLGFARFERKWEELFDKKHASMTDYVIWVDGLPTHATDEAELREWFEIEFRHWVPEDQPRRLETMGTWGSNNAEQVIQDSPIQVNSVSICYDYFNERNEVDDALWKMMEMTEVRMDESMTLEDTHWAGTGKAQGDIEAEELERVSKWFKDGNQKLKGTGQAFVVFTYQTDRDLIFDVYNQGKRMKHPNGTQDLGFWQSVTEPPNVQWWYFGLPEPDRRKRMVKFAGKLALIVLVIQGCVTLPYSFFVLWPYAATGSSASGVKVTIAGIILGNMNWICFLSNYLTAEQIGYRTKDWLYIFVFVSNTIVVYVLTGCNVMTAAHFVTHTYRISSGPKEYFSMLIASIGHEVAFTTNVYNMLMPGGFFVGLVICSIMAGPVPYTVTTLFSKVIYVWRCLPRCLLKIIKAFLAWAPESVDHYPAASAEKGLEPWEVPICGNYADFIVTPCLCFFMLFFLSPYSYRIMKGMMYWAVFMYIYFRWMHLRYHKTCYYHSPRLDVGFQYAWGIPLSVVAAASCAWALRAGMLIPNADAIAKVALICFVFLVSCLVWAITLTVCFRPWTRLDVVDDRKDTTFEQVQEHSIYSWLNCNPVFVLKCRYYFQDAEGREIKERSRGHPLSIAGDGQDVTFYQIGKQYLFLTKDQRRMLFTKALTNGLEFETWYEYILSLLGSFASDRNDKGPGWDDESSQTQRLLMTPGQSNESH